MKIKEKVIPPDLTAGNHHEFSELFHSISGSVCVRAEDWQLCFIIAVELFIQLL